MNAAAVPAEPGDKYTFVGDREVTIIEVNDKKATYAWTNGPVVENPDNKKKERLTFVVRRDVFEDAALATRIN